MNNAYDGKQRFHEELGKRTREIKEVLCTIRTDIDALQQATQQFNINEQFIVSDTATLTFPANTYHSISYVVLSGTANITEGGTLLSSAPQGYSAESEAVTLLQNSIIITGLSVGTKVVIKTIR